MSVLMLEHVFDRESTYHNLSKYTSAIKKNVFPAGTFKSFLKEIEKEFQQDTQLLIDIKGLLHEELTVLNQKIKKFNDGFDKLNDSCYDKSYFNDGELKQLFSSIGRQAHRIENVSHKYLFINQATGQTPAYIKEGLAKFSQEAVNKKITS